MLEAAIEAGAEDVVSGENGHEIYTASDSLARRRQGAGGEVRRAAQGGARSGSRRTPSRSTTSKGEKMLELIDGARRSNDDVQNVYANFEVSDALVAKASAG